MNNRLPASTAGYLIGVATLGAVLALLPDSSRSADAPAVSLSQTARAEQAATPSPILTPEQVVRIQLEALRNNSPDGEGFEISYRFASPSNKAHTGPLPRFAHMIENGVYSLMLTYNQAAYLPMEVMGRAARQRVTLYGDGRATTFTFYLSLQTGSTCSGCWMTEAVMAEPAAGQAI